MKKNIPISQYLVIRENKEENFGQRSLIGCKESLSRSKTKTPSGPPTRLSRSMLPTQRPLALLNGNPLPQDPLATVYDATPAPQYSQATVYDAT